MLASFAASGLEKWPFRFSSMRSSSLLDSTSGLGRGGVFVFPVRI